MPDSRAGGPRSDEAVHARDGVVWLLSSGWASDDQYEHGVFSTVELAKRAAPAELQWERSENANGRITYEAYSKVRFEGDYPWWIESFVLDRSYQVEQAVEALR